MSYTITLTNGNTLAVVADQSYDQVSSSITLIGKNLNAYGQYINNNFVGILENFASASSPRSPVQGQLWFDTLEGRIKVYAIDQFKPVGSPIIQDSEPGQAVLGDLWWNPTLKELKFYTGISWYRTSEQPNPFGVGKSSWFVEQLTDINNTDQTITTLYNNGMLMAAVTDVDITLSPSAPYLGTTTLRAGMTLDPQFIIYGTATNAVSWNNISTSSFLQKNIYQATTGALDILNNDGISVGTYTNMKLLIDDSLQAFNTTTGVLFMSNPNENFQVRYNNGVSGTSTAITLVSSQNRIGIFTNNPNDAFDINGNTIVRGTLTVLGTLTNIEATTLEVTTTNIILANGNNLDLVADGGGITLEGTTPKTFNWYNSTTSWTSSENLNLATGKTFKIGGVDVLSANSLGTGTYFAPGITALPAIYSFTASHFIVAGPSSISEVGRMYGDVSVGSDLYITAVNQKINLNGNNTIYNSPLVDGTYDPSTLVSKQYVDNLVTGAQGGFRKTFNVTIDITSVAQSGSSAINTYIIGYLNKVLPPNGVVPGASSIVPGYTPSDNTQYAIPAGSRCNVIAQYYTGQNQNFSLTLDKTYVQVDKGGVQNSQTVLEDVGASASVTTATTIFTLAVTHLVKAFVTKSAGTSTYWDWVVDIQ